MPVMGQGSGVRASELLDAWDTGIDRSNEVTRQRQAIRMGDEQHRGAVIGNDAQRDRAIREEALHAGRMENQDLINKLNAGNITQQEYNILKLERDERNAKSADHLGADAAIADVQRGIADDQHVIDTTPGTTQAKNAKSRQGVAEANANANETTRVEKRRKSTEKTDDDAAHYTALFNSANAEMLASAKMNEVDIQNKFTNRSDYEEAETRSGIDAYTALFGMASIHPAKVPGMLNNSSFFDIEGAVRSDVKDGVLRAYDKDGNISTDNSDRDGDGNPDKVEWRITDLLNDEMLKKYYPANWERHSAMLKQLSKSSGKSANPVQAVDAREKYADELRETTRAMLQEQYQGTLYDVEGKPIPNTPLTPSQQIEMKEIVARVQARSRKEGISYDEALQIESSHPELVYKLSRFGYDGSYVESVIADKLKTTRKIGADVSRLSILNDLVDYAVKEASKEKAQ